MNIIESIKDIIKFSLRGSTFNPNIPQIKSSDTFFMGDVHSQLDLFVQNLFIAGIIDKTGNIINQTGAPKRVIQLGDFIGTGKYELETLIFMRAFAKEAQKYNIDVIRLAGNHEFHAINTIPSSKHKYILKELLIDEINNDRLVLSYADNKNNFFALHGGLQKSTLIKVLLNMSNDASYSKFFKHKKQQLRELYINHKYKKLLDKVNEAPVYEYFKNETSSSKIFKEFIEELGLKLTDITKYMNAEFKKAIKEIQETGKPLCYEHPITCLTLHEYSIIHARKKALSNPCTDRGKNGYTDFLIRPEMKKYHIKPAQFVGHNCTNNGFLDFYGKKGGIMQNRSYIFCDAGLTSHHGSNQAFVFNNSTNSSVYAIELCENGKMKRGLDNEFLPISLDKKIDKIVVRKLDGIEICLKKNFKEMEAHKSDKQTKLPEILSLT